MIIKHKYIASNPIQQDSKALILGTIYPSKNTEEFMCDFFYGNEYTIWDILKTAFSNLDIYSYEEVKDGSKKTESADKIKAMLSQHKIAISDTILETEREGDDSADNFSKDTVYNTDLVEAIKNSSIETIYCTGVTVYTLFSQICRKEEVAIPSTAKSGEEITVSGFGRDVKVIVLPSPSPSGARGNTSYQEAKKQDESLKYETWCNPIYQEAFKKYLG